MYALGAVKIRMTNDFPIQGASPYSQNIALQPNPSRTSGLCAFMLPSRNFRTITQQYIDF
jgi:hypothetical protein